METVKLESPILSVEHPNGTTYTLEDPFEFVLKLIEDGLIDPNGDAGKKPEQMKALREATKTAFGLPSLTYAQLLQILEAVKAFVESLQKKTPSSPTSPQPTALSPKKMPVG